MRTLRESILSKDYDVDLSQYRYSVKSLVFMASVRSNFFNVARDSVIDTIWRLVAGWENGDRMLSNDGYNKSEAELAERLQGKLLTSSELKKEVKSFQKDHEFDLYMGLDCFPSAGSRIYSKTKYFVTFRQNNEFGWLAIPKSISDKDLAFIKQVIDFTK
jgi:hypothetical protein